MIFDCTWPKDWPKESIPEKASFENLWPKELQERVLKNWQNYGFQFPGWQVKLRVGLRYEQSKGMLHSHWQAES